MSAGTTEFTNHAVKRLSQIGLDIDMGKLILSQAKKIMSTGRTTKMYKNGSTVFIIDNRVPRRVVTVWDEVIMRRYQP